MRAPSARAAALPAAIAACLAAPLPASAQTSEYSSLGGPACRPARGPEGAENCPGPARHVLRVEGGGASDSVTLRFPGGGEASVFPPPGRDYPNGASVIGKVAEWRLDGGRVIGLILRRRVEREPSRLEVYKIVGPRLCWIANVGEREGGNVQARRLADTYRDLPCP